MSAAKEGGRVSQFQIFSDEGLNNIYFLLWPKFLSQLIFALFYYFTHVEIISKYKISSLKGNFIKKKWSANKYGFWRGGVEGGLAIFWFFSKKLGEGVGLFVILSDKGGRWGF